MLPAANRMRSAADFSETIRHGRKATRGSVVVYMLTPAEAAGDARVGLIVGRSVGGSVRRHRVARRIRGALAPLVASLPSGSRTVVRALPDAAADPDLVSHLTRGLSAARAPKDSGGRR